MLAVTHRSLLGTLKLRSVLHHRSEGHFGMSVECFGPLSSRWSDDGGVRLTVLPSYLHSRRPLPKRHNTDQASTGMASWHRPTGTGCYCPPSSFRSYSDRYANPSVHMSAHQMPEGFRWEGHSHLSIWDLVLSDKRINSQTVRQPARQRTEAEPKTPEAKPTGRGLSYFRLTIMVLLHKSIFECDHAYVCVHTHTHTHTLTLNLTLTLTLIPKLFLSNFSSAKVPSRLCYTASACGGLGGQISELGNLSGSLMSLSLLLALRFAANCTTNKPKTCTLWE